MPEGPEIEIIYRGLKKSILKKKIDQVIVKNNKLRWPIADSFPDQLYNREIVDIRRIAKYLVISLNNNNNLIIHLGMTGKIIYSEKFKDIEKHDHILFKFSDDTYLYYNDIRRFGFMEIIAEEAMLGHKFFAKFGVDPLNGELKKTYFSHIIRNLKKPIKNVIMDNRILTCVGNIYASESLYLASIHPMRFASSLNEVEIEKLLESIHVILNKAVEKNGSSFSDYRDSEGRKGEFQNFFNVYNRFNLYCYQCNNLIKKMKISGRASYFCDICQN